MHSAKSGLLDPRAWACFLASLNISCASGCTVPTNRAVMSDCGRDFMCSRAGFAPLFARNNCARVFMGRIIARREPDARAMSKALSDDQEGAPILTNGGSKEISKIDNFCY